MHSTFAPPRTARHARAVAALEARSPCAACPGSQHFASEPLDCTRVGLRPSVPRQRRRARRSAARRVAVRRLLLMLLPRRAVVPARGGTQLEGGVGDRRAGSLSSADAASRLGGGSCFAARVARRRTRLRSAAAARSERAGIARAGDEGEPRKRRRIRTPHACQRMGREWKRVVLG